MTRGVLMIEDRYETSPTRGDRTPLITAAVILVTIVALYVGAGIFVPLVLAILLAFALAPLVNRLRRWHFPHVAAVIISVLVAGLVLATIGYVVATQLVRLAADLPNYQVTVATKLKALQTSLGNNNFLDRLTSAIAQLKAQVSPAPSPTLASPGNSPVPVTIANTPDNPLGMAQSILGSVLGPLATAAIVVVFLVFLLLERADLRDRFLKLVSRGDLRTSTIVMDEAAARVGRYLLVQFSVNLVYGVILGTGLTLIGVPNGILWGLLATLFRYIPFVGTLILATIPFTLAFAVDPGWSMLLKSVGLFVVLETTATNVVEPRLYGSSTGLSALAVLVAAMFWATLWGPIGLILATPLTVCLVVLGRYVPQLQFLETLLGSQPVLRPAERLYQRLVAGNSDEAIDLAEHFDDAGDDPTRFYEEVAIPALRLAYADLSANSGDIGQRRRVVDSLGDVIDELEQEVEVAEENARVLVIGGRTELDSVAAKIVASLLQRAGTPARILPPVSIRREALGQLDTGAIDAICLVYLSRQALSYARFVTRRIRRRAPALKIIVCALADSDLPKLPVEVAADDVVTTNVSETVKLLLDWQAPGQAADLSTGNEPVEIEEQLKRLKLEVGTDPRVAEFLRGVAEQMSVAVAIASIADTDEVAIATRENTLAGNSLHGSGRLMDRVLETGSVLIVTDASNSKDFAEDPFLLESGVRFYAGAPLRDTEDHIVGVLAIMDETPRDLDEDGSGQLTGFAADLMRLLGSENLRQIKELRQVV